MDTDIQRVEDLASGEVPFCEPRLSEIIQSGMVAERLKFTLPWDFSEPLGQVAMVTTGTPPGMNGSADLTQVKSALAWVNERRGGVTEARVSPRICGRWTVWPSQSGWKPTSSER